MVLLLHAASALPPSSLMPPPASAASERLAVTTHGCLFRGRSRFRAVPSYGKGCRSFPWDLTKG